MTGTLYQVPVIIIASLLFSIVINQKFLGRTLTRAVFFIPVIVASGVVINVMMGDKIAVSLIGGAVPSGTQQTIFSSSSLQNMLINSGLNANFVNYFTSISNNLFDLLWRTGIQTIIFLAGLQTIPPSLYEASSIEGATAWENFWMITFPMLIPIMIVNIIYTIVDSFTNPSNKIMVQIINQFNILKFGEASAMAWTYFLLIGIVLAAIFIVSSRGDKEIKKQKKERR
jgi:ABC-type sugar transport system permease subunit